MTRITRRRALGYFGAAGLLRTLGSVAVAGESPVFPKGAVIRTLFRD